jgi:DNA-binding MarR family transcriptional regulator
MKKHSRSNSLVYTLERANRQVKLRLQKEFGAEISVDQWIVLSEIAAHPGQNNRSLAESTAKDPASITRTLALLLKKKLVKKTAAKNDNRSAIAVLTPAGKKTLQECSVKVENFRKATGKGLSQNELNELRRLLDMLFENSGGKLIHP